MREITERQNEILVFIKDFIQQKNYSPSIREIAVHFQISAPAVQCHKLALKKKGYLGSQFRKARTITVKEKSDVIFG